MGRHEPWTATRRRVRRPLNGFALGVINMLRLADWVSVKHCFDFEPSSGSYTRQHLPEPRRSLHGFVGFAQELRLGRGKKALSAVYRDGPTSTFQSVKHCGPSIRET